MSGSFCSKCGGPIRERRYCKACGATCMVKDPNA